MVAFAWVMLPSGKYILGPAGWAGPIKPLALLLNLQYSPGGVAGDPIATAVAKVVAHFKLAVTDYWVRPLPPAKPVMVY
jgi:hypothetical protein